MCGIAGYITTEPSPQNHALLERMTDSIRHRGPDDCGYYQDAWASLGHRRLSIIDVAGGHQPMSNEDGGIWIVFNGEIFNHADLRPALERNGHQYVTRCDTETLVHAYEEYGRDCVKLYRGMFAFAIWDRQKRRLFCARDRLGKKPLYYYWDGRTLVFASEIKAILAHPAVSARFEEALLAEYLAFGYISEERTMFSGIRKLMPGHHLILDLKKTKPEPEISAYWEIPAPAAEAKQPDAEWIRECRSRLEETVRMRLMSDVPLGVFLSGGLDSSAIAALMKRHFDGPVKTFSVGYAERAFSELGYARQVAEAIGSDHHEVTVSMEEFFNALPQLVWHEDEPITWPSSVCLYFVSQLASQQVKVVLTGEGSDEMFGGYARYHFFDVNQRFLRYYGVLPAAWRRAVRGWVSTTGLLSANLRRKLQHTVVGREESFEALYLDNFYSAFPASLPAAYASFQRYWKQTDGWEGLARLLYTDQKTYLVELLMKQDQMSMATSIESRVPFLDHEFVEFSTRVPATLKVRGGAGKYIVKKAVEGLLPKEIIYRRKMGFPTPLRQWLLDRRAQPIFDYLRTADGVIGGYVERAKLDDLLERQERGMEDGTDRIWRLLNLQIWGDVFLTGRRERIWDGLLVDSAHAVRR
jgi:asparagine synthase (glutamine-hydrolysing)